MSLIYARITDTTILRDYKNALTPGARIVARWPKHSATTNYPSNPWTGSPATTARPHWNSAIASGFPRKAPVNATCASPAPSSSPPPPTPHASEVITSVFPGTVVQTCVVRVIRGAMRFVSFKDRKKLAAAMREVCTVPSVEVAEFALADMDKTRGVQYPGVVDVWWHVWNEFIPFLEFPPELRKVVCTTNLIESINHQLR